MPETLGERRPDPDRMIWSAPETERAGRPLLVLMHGRYGDAEDMTPFFDGLPPEVVAVSLRGPVAHGDRWEWANWEADGIEGVRATTRGLFGWLDHLPRHSSVGLAGFSQGGAMALTLLRKAPRRFAYAVQVCGFVPPEVAGDEEELTAVRPPVLNLRGARDTAIPADLAEYTSEWLRRHTNVTERVYPDLDHRITKEFAAATANFVADHVRSVRG
jgi:phospholipase/carboxylesterase